MQQVAQSLNKDSAFQLVTLTKLKEWWRNILVQATAAETAETVATTANTAAQTANSQATGAATGSQAANTVATGGQAAAATAGTVANIGLAGAFRAVGLAIKSIPVFGWILAGISALIGLYQLFSSKAREAKKAQEELNQKIIELAAKPVGSIIQLKNQYVSLGNSMKEKEKFIRDNAKVFEELGLVIRSVADAERLLSDPANVRKFIQAQIDKARSLALVESDSFKKALSKYTEIYSKIESAKESKEAIRKTNSPHALTSMYNRDIEIKELESELAPYQKTLEKAYMDSFKATKAFNDKIDDLNKESIDNLKGTIAGQRLALEDEIKKLEADRDKLSANDKKGLDQINKQIENVRKKITSLGGGSSTIQKDVFSEMLNEKKKQYSEYLRWLNSGDKTLVKAANKEFEGLLKQGATYIDYLKKQRDIIESVDVANRTKAQNQQLRTLRDQIAEETKKTVLQAFNEELSEQLNNAKSTLEMLNIIEEKRKKLANDGTELDNSKKETLDDAEKNAVKNELKKQKEETDNLLENYASYLDKKIKLEQDYNNDLVLLEKRRSEATTDEERAKTDAAKANRTKQYEKDSKGSGDAEYDELLKSYADFEQKKQLIIDDYDEKRKTATEHRKDLNKALEEAKTDDEKAEIQKRIDNNKNLIDALDKAQAKALSKLALDEMQINPDWEKMFGNLDEISTRKLEEILQMIEGQTTFLGVEFDPKDLETIKAKIEEIKGEIQERNPFKALIKGIKDYSKVADDNSKKKALTYMFESAAKAIDLVSGSLNAVIDGMEKMGIQMDESTQQVMKDIGGILDGASQLASGIASGNPLSIIQGSVGLLTSAFDLFNTRDRAAEKAIKKHAEALKILESSYRDLSRAVDKALGSSVYDNQKASIANMREQQKHLQKMIDAEDSKKKTDHEKTEQWRQQIKDLGYAIEDTIESIADDVLQTSGKSFADELGDALVNAFAKGESAAEAFGQTADKIIKQAVLNQLKKNFLETQLQGALDNLYKSMGGNGEDFRWDGLTNAEKAAFKAQVATISNEFNKQLEAYSDIFKDLGAPDIDTSLTGAVKGVTEETASLVAGQMNAIRINQMEATAILRQQLMHLETIAQNTSYNHFLQSIDARLERLGNSGDTLRSQGLS